MDWLSDPQIWVGLLTLTAMEIVLGIDNLVLIAVLVGRVKAERQALARKLGLAVALGTRLALLGGITWIAKLTRTGAGHRRASVLVARSDHGRRRALPALQGHVRGSFAP